MSCRIAFCGTALVALLVTIPSQAQLIYDPGRLPSREALGRLQLERAWYTSIPAQPGLERVINLSLSPDGELLFAQTSAANLYTYEAESGRLRWKIDLGSPSGEAQDVGTNDTTIFVSNSSVLFAIDRISGRIIWEERLEATASSPTVATNELAVVGLDTGKIVAYSLVPREDTRFRPDEGPPGGFAFAYSTNGPITAEPIPTQFVLAFGSNDGKLYASEYDPPRILHRSQPLGTIEASMAFSGSGPESLLIVPTLNGEVYGINLFSGIQTWVFSANGPVAAQPLVGGGNISITVKVPETRTKTVVGTDLKEYQQDYTVLVDEERVIEMTPAIYILNERGSLYSVNPETGRGYWEIAPTGIETGAEQILALSQNRIYLRTEFGDLAIVDRETGGLVASPVDTYGRAGLRLRDYEYAVTNDINDRIYLATRFGSLICIHEQGLDQPLPLRDRETKPFGFLREVNPTFGEDSLDDPLGFDFRENGNDRFGRGRFQNDPIGSENRNRATERRGVRRF